MACGYKHFEAIEKNAGLLGILIAIMVSIGGLAEITPLFMEAHAVRSPPGVEAVRPAAPGRQGRLRARGLLPVPLADDPRASRFETQRYGPYSIAAESVYDRPFQWGSKRTGPDLARIGEQILRCAGSGCISSSARRWSRLRTCPAYRWLESAALDGDDIAGANARAARAG